MKTLNTEVQLWLVERVTKPVNGRKYEVFRFLVLAAEKAEAIGYAKTAFRNPDEGEWLASPWGRSWQLQTKDVSKKEVEAMRLLHQQRDG